MPRAWVPVALDLVLSLGRLDRLPLHIGALHKPPSGGNVPAPLGGCPRLGLAGLLPIRRAPHLDRSRGPRHRLGRYLEVVIAKLPGAVGVMRLEIRNSKARGRAVNLVEKRIRLTAIHFLHRVTVRPVSTSGPTDGATAAASATTAFSGKLDGGIVSRVR
jgi:hypothetical protein